MMSENDKTDNALECNEEVCEAQEGLDAFCDAVSGEDAKTKCGEVMGMLKQGQIDADSARDRLIEEIGEESYTEGTEGLKHWLEKVVLPDVEETEEAVPAPEVISEQSPIMDIGMEEITDETIAESVMSSVTEEVVNEIVTESIMEPVPDDYAEGGFIGESPHGEPTGPEVDTKEEDVEILPEVEPLSEPALVEDSQQPEESQVPLPKVDIPSQEDD